MNNRTRTRFLPLLLIGLLTLAASQTLARRHPAGVFAQTAARYLSPSGRDTANTCLDSAAPCATLAHALDLALPGDTIHLAPGDYWETGLLIDKTVTIRGGGAGTTRLDGQGRDTLLRVSGGALTLEDVTLRGGAGQRGGAVAVTNGGNSSRGGRRC